MTKKEAKQVFLSRGFVEVEGGTIYDADKWRESCRVISEWIEQQPCGDAISREDAEECKELMTDVSGDTVYAVRMSDIRQLPPVTPQPKTGHCKDCKYFRILPYHIDTLGKCIQHAGFCPKGDWYCADYEPQERSDT